MKKRIDGEVYCTLVLKTAALVLFLAAAAGGIRPMENNAGTTFGGPSPGGGIEDPEVVDLPKAGKKIPIDDEFYFIYNFAEKPRLGPVILRIQVFDRNGEKAMPFSVLTEYDMPSMRGAHASGLQEFKISNRGDYLLPVNVVMPGEWEVVLHFKKGEETVFKGRFLFDV